MSRAHKDPTANEIRFVQEQLLGGKEPRYIKWVTKKKRDKVQDRLIVVGDYRIFSIKKTLTGKKQIQRVGHLFDLVELFSSDVDKVVMKFKEFDIDVTTSTAGIDLVFAVRRAFQEVSYSFAEYAMPKVILIPQERVLQELPQIDPGPADGILATYVAFCDYYKQSPSQEFIKYVKDIVAKGSRDLNLENCPGIERKEDSINFAPIRAALRHNTYFSSFSLKNVPRKEVTICIADTLMHNITLEKICLSGVDASEQAMTAFGNSLKRNQHNRVTDLDLSHNTNMKEKGALGLADGLQGMSHSLTRLCLAFCNLGSKSASSIISALCFGKDVGWGLCELDLSYNKLESSGSIQLANWFNQQGKNLKYLLLANTKLDVGLVMRAIKTNGEINHLQELDLSGNKMDPISGSCVAAAIEHLPSLNIINVARCGLNSVSAVAIVTSVASNTSIQSCSLNLSENQLGVAGASSISQILVNCSNISSLILRNCEFKKEGLSKFAIALGQNATLRVLDLSMNFRSGTAAKMSKLINALAESVSRHPTLAYLSIAGDFSKYSIGKEIEPIIRCLSNNPVLEELDISGNKIGDQLAVVLCDTLRVNNRLKYLNWDKNNISTGGWQALLNILGQNTSLLEVPSPKHDSEKAIKEAKNKEQFKERVRVVLDGIHDALKKNLGGLPYTSAIQKAKGRTYSVAVPFPEMNESNGLYGFDRQGTLQMDPNQMQNYGSTNMNSYNNNGYQQQQQQQYSQQMDYYSQPPQPPERDPLYGSIYGNGSPPPTPPPPPPMMMPGMSRTNSGTLSGGGSSPPPTPPPPPPMPRNNTKSNLTKQSSTASLGNGNGTPEVYDTFNFDETAISDDYQQEYDDNYDESSSAPPPPPPPPF